MSLSDALNFFEEGKAEAIAELVEELRIPSISTTPSSRGDCLRNAEWLVEKFRGIGFTASLHDVLDGGLPVLRAEWMGRAGAHTTTIYGHYDVQPPDPLDEWKSPPFEPLIEGDMLYARGSADNKGNHMAAFEACKFWMKTGGPPVNVRFLLEGEEEIGGESLPTYVRANASTLTTDSIFVWDSGLSADDMPTLCTGLRGMVYTEIEIRGTSHDLHSGAFGGVAPNAAFELARVLSKLKDDDERVTVPGFYDDVVLPDSAEIADWHIADADEGSTLSAMGAKALLGEAGFEPVYRVWSRPTLEVNGIGGGFQGEGQKTVIPATATAKVSMRLVANQDPQKIWKAFEAHVLGLVRTEFDVRVSFLSGAPAVVCGVDNEPSRAAREAFSEVFGKPTVLVRSGGSIPVATAFAALGAPIIISGIAHSNSRMHSPNEWLSLQNYFGGIEMMIRVLAKL